MTTSVPTTKPPGEGWAEWANRNGIDRPEPYDYAEVETWREGWKQTGLEDPHNCNPYMNAIGLYWRPAGPKLTEQAKFEKALRKLIIR